MNKSDLSLVICATAVTIYTLPVLVLAQTVEGARVTGIRAYADGNMHIFLNKSISATCGSIVRVGGPGQEDVRALALAALMSGRTLRIESTPERNGNFCDLIWARIGDD